METGRLDYCNCGHNPPVLGSSFLEVEPNAPIGLWQGLQYEGKHIDNIKGMPLFIYTDGLNEAENRQQQQFGDDRLLQVLTEQVSGTAQQVITNMVEEIEKHRDGAEPNDDLTMLYLKVE